MVHIPMRTKNPMRTPDLVRINQPGRKHTLQMLLQPADRRNSSTPPVPARNAPPPASVRGTPPPMPVVRRSHPPVTGTILQKGQKISLSRLEPNLDILEVGLGWDLAPGGQSYDLDAEAFLLGPSGMVLGDDWFVFYNQPVSPDGAVRLLTADASGAGHEDDEVLRVCLRQVNPNIAKIAFILTINEARTYGYHFGNVANAYVRLVSQSTHRELVRFQLTDYYSNVCSMVVGELYRYNSEWRFNPVGNGTGDDLAGLCMQYGVNT